MYEDNDSLNRYIKLLRSLCSIKLKIFKSRKEYSNEIISPVQLFDAVGKLIQDEFLNASNIHQTLPEEPKLRHKTIENVVH